MKVCTSVEQPGLYSFASFLHCCLAVIRQTFGDAFKHWGCGGGGKGWGGVREGGERRVACVNLVNTVSGC